MAYRPTNDVKENIIHRNTVFDSQGIVSCCTCGYCIKKTEDATLTITNFKPADPLINEDSIGSNIIEFSDYMIPTGSFEYALIPTALGTNDSSVVTDYKFSDSLTYYPFLRCNGITTTDIIGSDVGEDFEFIKNNKQYGASFASSYYYYYILYIYNYGVIPNPEAIDSAASMSLINYIGPIGSIIYDPIQFGSCAVSTGNITYSNTDINMSFFQPLGCSTNFPLPPVADALTYTPCSNKNDFYSWGKPNFFYSSNPYIYQSSYLEKKDVQDILDAKYNYFYNYLYSYLGIPKKSVLSFSQELQFNLIDILESGPNENYAAATKFNFGYYDKFYNFLSLSGFQSGNYGGVNFSTRSVKVVNDLITARTFWFELSPNQDSPPCTQEQVASLYGLNSATTNIQSFFNPISIPLPKVDVGDYQTYFNYLDSHEYSNKGFKSESECTNNIVKIMEPVFFKSFDDYEFSFEHDGYILQSKVFGITDKFIVPDRTSWNDCHGEWSRESLQSPWTYNPPPVKPAKTVEFQEINSLFKTYKEGYILHGFEFKKDGSFTGRIDLVAENDFYSVGLDSFYETQKIPGFGPNSCSYYTNFIIDRVRPTTYYWYWNQNPKPFIYTSPLIYSNKFINAYPSIFIEYIDQEAVGHYVNGSFLFSDSVFPLTYYEDACQGMIAEAAPLALQGYYAQKTNRTKTTSKTDSSGLTTVTIENVLWVGKTLLTETYINENGPLNIKGGVTKLKLLYPNYTFQSTPTITIAPPSIPLKPGDSVATAIAVLENNKISELIITNPGSGYTSIPSVFVNSATFIVVAEIEDNRNLIANNIKVPDSYTSTLKGGFESDVEIKFQSVPICKKDGIVDRMKRVNQIKVNFEEYRKIPQQNTTTYDYQNYFIQATPGTPDGYFNYNSTSFEFNSLKNTAYAPPDVNPDGVIYLKNNPNTNSYSFLKQIEQLPSPISKKYSATPTISYPDFGVPDKFKSCLLINGDQSVWETGNQVKFGTGTTTYYSIFIDEIKDHKQTAGQSLIRIATTLQNALDGIYIPNVGLEQQFKNKVLTVDIQYEYEDVTIKNSPHYSDDYDPNELDFTNENAEKMNASYSTNGTYPVISNGSIRLINYTDYYYPLPYFSWGNYFDFYGFDKMEIISFSPLKIKYFGCRFSTNYVYTYTNYLISNLITPDNVLIPGFITNRDYGFMCDIVIEEVVDEFIEEALPVEFNQILENVEYIQTSNLMNARKPLQMINPEKCEHIGKVIDRKDCNCPKKWIRECELHGKTDWKKCMTCKDFKPSE